jgi:methylmalonyl-CoA/ethylmalonyl-CoA epimerase
MFQKIEHIGIAVKDMESAVEVYSALFGEKPYKTELVEGEQVSTSFFRCGPNKIELVSATSISSPIFSYLEKNREGVHHIAFAVDDIEKSMQDLASKGFKLLNEKPKIGADNKLICFVHPKSANGVLIELCQERK